MRIVFVCTGNTCRSPMAAAIWRAEGMDVQSAGVHAAHGAPMSPYAKQALKEKGLPTDHASQPVTKELLDWADIVLTMTSSHKEAILHRFPHVDAKLFTYAEFATPDNPFEIADPFGGTLQDYQFTLYQLQELQKQMRTRLDSYSD